MTRFHQFAGGSLAGKDCMPHSSTMSMRRGIGPASSGGRTTGATRLVRSPSRASRTVVEKPIVATFESFTRGSGERVRGTLVSPFARGGVQSECSRAAVASRGSSGQLGCIAAADPRQAVPGGGPLTLPAQIAVPKTSGTASRSRYCVMTWGGPGISRAPGCRGEPTRESDAPVCHRHERRQGVRGSARP
jgi:hypothetical protein